MRHGGVGSGAMRGLGRANTNVAAIAAAIMTAVVAPNTARAFHVDRRPGEAVNSCGRSTAAGDSLAGSGAGRGGSIQTSGGVSSIGGGRRTS